MTEASAPASCREPARPCRRVRFRSRKQASLRMSGRASGPTGIAAHGPTGPIPGRVRSARLRRCAMRVAPRIRGSMPARSCCGSRALKAHGSRSSASVQVAAMSVAIYASGPSRRLPSSSGLPMQCRSRRSAVRAGKRTCPGRAWSLVWSGTTRPLSGSSPMPRMQEAPRQERAFREPPRPMPQPRMQLQQVRPVPGPSGGGRQGGGNAVRCRPGWPCGTEEVR